MRTRTYLDALRTTARVTAVFALAGCGGAIAPDPDPITHQDPEPQPTADPAPDTKSPAPKHGASSGFAACNATLTSRVDGGLDTSPVVADCCDVVLAHVSSHWEDYSKVDPHVLAACCQIARQDGGFGPAACTPWGPPMPPAMTFGAELVS